MIYSNLFGGMSYSMMRRSLIRKGMIYAPSLGMVAYTVPMFGSYMRRIVKTDLSVS